MRTKSLVFASAILFAATMEAQLLTENFSFSGELAANGWTAHSGAGTNPILTTGGLTFAGHPLSGIGNAAGLTNNGEDVNRLFTASTTGDVYVSFLVRVDDGPSSGTSNFFLHLGQSPFNATAFRGKVFMQKSGVNALQFGLSFADNTPVLTLPIYTLGIVYVVVVKYSITSGTNNDEVRLFVFDTDLPALEPVSATIGPLTESGNADLANVGSIALRQFNTLQRIVVDGICIATSWPALSLPVELSRFESSVRRRSVLLEWTTATEENNSGFSVERKSVGGKWNTLGFVKGHGTSNASNSYTYSDAVAAGDRYIYRLKQIDNGGKFEYSREVEATVAPQAEEFIMTQNYPNPFNPTTSIRFAMKRSQHASVKVYNLMGQEVAILFDGTAVGDMMNTISFDASHLPTGNYFYRLQSDERSETKWMSLIK
ncbi:MAG: T9SS type A sorting domain-containing protein [Ignavibacteriales bacterium]|nr:T9SS type A sorting domain-containing protein [Ignavibacteriales bacterium]